MQLSIVDLSPRPPGGSAADAYANSVDLAQHAERLGYRRYWVAEHHGNGAAVAGVAPEVLTARIAAATSSLRVGSAAVLLDYNAPLRTVETFQALEAMFPGRVDLGLGRARSMPVVDAALRPERAQEHDDPLGGLAQWMEHDDRLSEVIDWLDGRFRPTDPRAAVRLVEGRPELWLHGSSLTSALTAARLGLRYGYAGFFNPEMATACLTSYRTAFRPSSSPSGVERPWAALAVNVCCADDDDAADRLRASVEVFYRDGGDAGHRPLLPADDALRELGGVVPASPAHLAGGPARIRGTLERAMAETEADELVVQDLIADHHDRVRSYELLAEVFAMVPSTTGFART